jgi:hypothetical protein
MIAGRIVAEPREQMYREFVSVLASMAERFLLVQHSLPIAGITREEEEIFATLAPWCVLVEERADWPGTTHGPGARADQPIYEYATAPGAIEVLQQTVSGLYEWLTPRPEDLAFLRTDGSVILYSVAHEQEAELSLTSSERDTLIRKWPGVAQCVRWIESV